MKHNQENMEAALIAGTGERPDRSILRARGQAAVEFALISVVAMIVLFVAVQLALIGEDALALGQMFAGDGSYNWGSERTVGNPASCESHEGALMFSSFSLHV